MPKLTPSEVSEAIAQTDAQASIQSKAVTWSDLQSMGATIVDHADGTRTAHLGADKIKTASEALRPVRRAMASEGDRQMSKKSFVTIKGRSGRTRPVPVEVAERVCKRSGATEVKSYKPNWTYREGRWLRRVGKDWVEVE